MKKYYLEKVMQKNKVFYILIVDPRKVVGLLPKVQAGEEQKAQRPWVTKKVKDIAAYVAGKVKLDGKYKVLGLIPNSPIVAINSPLKVQEEQVEIISNGVKTVENRYFILLPETEKEIQDYENTIDPIDGQHRLRSFDEEYRDPEFKDSEVYEMTMILFDNLTLNERKELFMMTNEKQEKVATNLIRLFKKALGLLDEVQEELFEVVSGLNDETFSPLYNRIMMGSQKVSKGYKEMQVSKILDKSKTMQNLSTYDTARKVKIISNYLAGWEKVYEVEYQNPKTDTLTKISGIRYIMYLFPVIFDRLMRLQKTATRDNFADIIKDLPEAIHVQNVFEDSVTSLSFRGEGATTKMANDHGYELKQYFNTHNGSFDPTRGI